jgi:hypothetical protein
MEPLGTSVLHIAVVRFWYVLDGERAELEQIGQTLACYEKADGSKTIVDEDAPKKSVTDALVKCASYIGFAGDIFSGRWDDSRYVAWAREQYTEREEESESEAPAKPVQQKAGVRHKPTDGDVAVPEERQTAIQLAASLAVQRFKQGDKDAAYDALEAYLDSGEEELYLWQVVGSAPALRAYIKFRKEQNAKRQEQGEPA